MRDLEEAHKRLDNVELKLHDITRDISANTAMTEGIAADVKEVIELFTWSKITKRIVLGIAPILAGCYAAWDWVKHHIKVL